jgi:hypothetical protein
VIYGYAITEPSRARWDASGLEDAPLRTVQAGGVQGVCSQHAELDLTPTPELLWTHDAVVAELMRRGPVLPLRFGTGMPDVAALRSVLRRNGADFLSQLERVRGRVELAVRLGLPPGDGDRKASDGSSYMHSKLAALRAGEEAAERVLVPLAGLASATALSRSGPDPVVKASYLVAAGEVERFATAVQRLQERNPELSLSCTGPWAPYSFVAGEVHP